MKVLVVLGNRLGDDASMSQYLIQRLNKALELEKDFDRIITCGGLANPAAGVAESVLMRAYLIEHGVDAGKILIEDKSTTTKENAKNAAPTLKTLGVNEITLVSSAYHIKRWYLNPVRLFKHFTKCKVNSVCAD